MPVRPYADVGRTPSVIRPRVGADRPPGTTTVVQSPTRRLSSARLAFTMSAPTRAALTTGVRTSNFVTRGEISPLRCVRRGRRSSLPVVVRLCHQGPPMPSTIKTGSFRHHASNERMITPTGENGDNPGGISGKKPMDSTENPLSPFPRPKLHISSCQELD